MQGFFSNPKLSHEWAVTRIGRCLLDTMDNSLTCRIDKNKGLECFVDTDFAGGWNASDLLNAENALSRTGFVITHAGIPTFWRSKLQTEDALSTCETESINFSTAMCKVIPLIELLKDLSETCDVITTPLSVTCKVFEDN